MMSNLIYTLCLHGKYSLKVISALGVDYVFHVFHLYNVVYRDRMSIGRQYIENNNILYSTQ